MNEYTIKKINIIKKSAELLLENYEKRGLKNTIMETGLKDILGMCDSILEDIPDEKAREYFKRASPVPSPDPKRSPTKQTI